MKNMMFKILCWLGKKTNIVGLPICRVYNDANTEHYTLLNDGWVITQSVNGISTDALPVYFVGHELQERFSELLKDEETKNTKAVK